MHIYSIVYIIVFCGFYTQWYRIYTNIYLRWFTLIKIVANTVNVLLNVSLDLTLV